MEKITILFSITADPTSRVITVLNMANGEKKIPPCGEDMLAVHNYLMGRGRIEEAQQKLREFMQGGYPITDMKKRASLQAA